MKKTLLASLVLAFVVGGLVGCNSSPSASATTGETTTGETTTGETTTTSAGETTGTPAPEPGPAAVPTVKEEDQKGPVKLETIGEGEIAKRVPKAGEEVGVLKTAYGRIVLMFFPDKAPNMVKRFKAAIKEGVYNGTVFHRIMPGFMIQGGDPNSKDDDPGNDGSGGWGEMLKAEFNDVKHVPGILSTARTTEPDTAQSQFFIVHGDASFLDGQYTVFGKVLEGLKVVDTIVNLPSTGNQGDPNHPNMPPNYPLPPNVPKILKAEVVKWPLK